MELKQWQQAHSCAAEDKRRQGVGGSQLCRPKTRDGKCRGPTVVPTKTRDGKVQETHSCAAQRPETASVGGPQLCRPKTRDGKVQRAHSCAAQRGETARYSQLKCQPSKGPQIGPGPWPKHPSQVSVLQYLQGTWIYCLPQVYDIAYNPPAPYPLSFNDLGAVWENSARNMIGEQLGYRPVTAREIGPTANRQSLRRRYDYHR